MRLLVFHKPAERITIIPLKEDMLVLKDVRGAWHKGYGLMMERTYEMYNGGMVVIHQVSFVSTLTIRLKTTGKSKEELEKLVQPYCRKIKV